MKIHLENFFDIKSSEIDLKPLMIICGDNGTGKTHLIKLLSKINELLLDGVFFKVNENDLPEISHFLDLDELREKLLLRQSIDIEINSESLQKLYIYLEEVVNRNIKKQLVSIWNSTFGKTNSLKKKLKINVEFNNRAANLKTSINFSNLKDNAHLNLLNNLNELSINSKNSRVFSELLEKLEQLNDLKILDLTFEIKTPEYITQRGLSLMGENINIENKMNEIICSTIENIFAHLYSVDLNIKGISPELYYLPASREAYHRDLEHFRKKLNEKSENLLVSRYIVDKKGRKTNSFNSKDPFIEQYVEDILQTLTREVETNLMDGKTKNLLNYFEENIMEAKILVDSGTVKFKLPNKDIITPSMASSLQNEYSFLKILIERSHKPNLIIEEPESHLSINNAIKLAYFLLCYQYNNKNLLWLTTHNNFIGDAINNFIMISKLTETEQREFLNLLGINTIVDKIDSNFENRIAAYLIFNNKIEELPKNEYGINFENFNSEINKFVNITTELQVKMDDCIE